MNATAKRIRDIIKADVCGKCPEPIGTISCCIHYDRCHAAYDRQAHDIYRQVVEPLERQIKELARESTCPTCPK